LAEDENANSKEFLHELKMLQVGRRNDVKEAGHGTIDLELGNVPQDKIRCLSP
jgi:hypothetical protein